MIQCTLFYWIYFAVVNVCWYTLHVFSYLCFTPGQNAMRFCKSTSFVCFPHVKLIFVDHVPHHCPQGKSPISLVESPISLGKSPISLGKSPISLAKSPFSTENAHLALQQFQGSTASGATMSHLEAMANDDSTKFIGFPWGANKNC